MHILLVPIRFKLLPPINGLFITLLITEFLCRFSRTEKYTQWNTCFFPSERVLCCFTFLTVLDVHVCRRKIPVAKPTYCICVTLHRVKNYIASPVIKWSRYRRPFKTKNCKYKTSSIFHHVPIFLYDHLFWSKATKFHLSFVQNTDHTGKGRYASNWNSVDNF